MSLSPTIQQLVSVVIPCYNHGQYLSKAIESVLEQNHRNIEIIVVDDGSTDNTKEVAAQYPQVRYIYKQNGGLSAARNTGIEKSRGEYLLFLDADDWLYPGAITTNLHYLTQNPKAAFVSGAHDKVYVEENKVVPVTKDRIDNVYIELLSKGNFIGVPAAVLYQRWVFEEFQYDTSLKSCEDYDLYLRIARRYPVLHHTQKIAAYRMHKSNMSSKSLFMLDYALKVLIRQYPVLKTATEKKAYHKGIAFWKAFYFNDTYLKLKAGKVEEKGKGMIKLLLNKPHYIFRFLLDGILLKR